MPTGEVDAPDGEFRRLPVGQQVDELAAADQWPGEVGRLQGDAGAGQGGLSRPARGVAGVSGRFDPLGRGQPRNVSVDRPMQEDGDPLVGSEIFLPVPLFFDRMRGLSMSAQVAELVDALVSGTSG